MVKSLIGNNAKKFIYILLCLTLWNCGGSNPIRVTTETDLSDNTSTEMDRKNYPGFIEASQKPINKSDFYNVFFDRHPESINGFVYDFDTKQVEDSAIASTKQISTTTFADYNGTASQVFVLYDKYNVVNLHLSWDPEESFANIDDLKFFLCNIDNEKDISPREDIDYEFIDGLNCSMESNMCSIDQSLWHKGEMDVTLEINADRLNKNERIGLCMQYASYLPVLYDALEVKVYETQTFDITLVHIGSNDDSFKERVEERINKTLNRAGVEINFTKDITYQIPEDLTNTAYTERDLNDKYLYVTVATNGRSSDCYAYLQDDLYWVKDKIESDIGSNKNERRTAVVLNQPTVRFWTIDYNYQPCTTNLKDWPQESASYGYIVGILSSEQTNCQQEFPNSGEVFYGYNREKEKMGWYNIYGQSIDSEISSYISPQCHILIDLNRFGQQNNANSRYYGSLMPSTSLGVTTPAQSVGGISGLMSFNPPDEVVFVHELTHLLGLSDLEEQEKNLMYKNNLKGTHLGNIPLKAKVYKKNETLSGSEQQWDCLHNENNADGCLDRSSRLLNF